MIKRPLKKWLIAGSLMAVLGTSIYSYGCADGWWSYGSSSSFSPESFADKSYTPLFYAPYDRFYNGAYMNNGGMFNDEILDDWTNYLKGSLSKDVVGKYLLDVKANADDIYSMYSDWSKKKNIASATKWNLKNEKIANFVAFLYYSSEIESYSNVTYNYWDYDNHVTVYMDENQVAKVEKFYNKVKGSDTFFSNRMWFQVMKAKFYSSNKFSTVAYFDKTAKDQPKNALYYRALSYVAGAYQGQGMIEKANILYAEVFNSYPTMRQVAAFNYKVQDNTGMNNMLKAAPNKEVQASVLAMQGYYDDGNLLESMQKIYEVDPKSPHINYLLTRWVNIQEGSVLQFRDESFKSSKEYFSKIKNKIDQKGLKWVKSIAAQPNKVDSPVLWTLASGYLDIFQGNYKDAASAFDLAKGQAKNDDLTLKQIRLFGLINKVSQVKKVDASTEATLLADMKWLYDDINKNNTYDSDFRYEYAIGWIRQYLSAVYKEQGNAVMSEVMYSDVTFYSNEKNSKMMEAFFLSEKKTAFEKIIIDAYQYNINDIYERRGIYLFYENRLEEAITEFKKTKPVEVGKDYEGQPIIASYGESELYGNPFNGKIQDCNDCDHAAKQSVKYTKLSLVSKMKEMQDKIAKGEDVFNNALLVGNAFYNASYFGNARAFYSSSLVGEYGNYISKDGQKYLMNMSNVRKYYNIAKEAATTKEQKAKIAYLSAKLERNEFYRDQYFGSGNYWGYDQVMFKKWNGFKELATQYNDTKYYQDVIRECGYFRKYLGMN
ncbi:MAG: hypothetical protein LBI72_09270 [Flavobacteriaceae bacterium]|jgi:hypothetical protein|nr:hypothetical protein [Flavobacteriaceae bacterium]